MGLIYKNLEVITNDGYKIETWFFPAQSPLSEGELRDLNGNRRTYETQDETKRPTIIVCNGDVGNMSYFQLYLAKSRTSRGFNVVTFDWRGFGKSSPFAWKFATTCVIRKCWKITGLSYEPPPNRRRS